MNLEFRSNDLALLGLKPSEERIILSISKIGKSIAMISRHAKVPRTSILYMLKKLQKKEYVYPVIVGKRRVWRSNIPKILLYLSNNQKMKKKRISDTISS